MVNLDILKNKSIFGGNERQYIYIGTHKKNSPKFPVVESGFFGANVRHITPNCAEP